MHSIQRSLSSVSDIGCSCQRSDLSRELRHHEIEFPRSRTDHMQATPFANSRALASQLLEIDGEPGTHGRSGLDMLDAVPALDHTQPVRWSAGRKLTLTP